MFFTESTFLHSFLDNIAFDSTAPRNDRKLFLRSWQSPACDCTIQPGSPGVSWCHGVVQGLGKTMENRIQRDAENDEPLDLGNRMGEGWRRQKPWNGDFVYLCLSLFHCFEVPRFLDDTEHAPCWLRSRRPLGSTWRPDTFRHKATIAQQLRTVACQSRQEIIAGVDSVCSAH